MKKLNISQLMKLSEYIESSNFSMLITLIDLNNKGKIEKFFKMIGKTELLKDFFIEEQKQNSK